MTCLVVALVSLALLATPLAAEAQPGKVPRIGWLSIASRTPGVSYLLKAFSRGLR